MQHRSMAALTLLQKHIHQRDAAEVMERLATVLLAGYHSSSQVVSLVNYLLQAGETADAKAFVRELARRVPQHGDSLMTIAQQLEQIGIEQGRMEGIRLGMAKGERAAKFKIARAMLQSGMDRHTILQMTGLSEAEVADIRQTD